MSKKKEIIIECDDDGNVKIEAFNFQGSACELATQPFRMALGCKTTKSGKKKEYSAQNVGRQNT